MSENFTSFIVQLYLFSNVYIFYMIWTLLTFTHCALTFICKLLRHGSRSKAKQESERELHVFLCKETTQRKYFGNCCCTFRHICTYVKIYCCGFMKKTSKIINRREKIKDGILSEKEHLHNFNYVVCECKIHYRKDN